MREKPYNYDHNDGVLTVYEDITPKSGFNAIQNPTTMSDLEKLLVLRFCRMNVRQQDMEWAEMMQRSLALKLRTPFVRAVDAGHLVMLAGDADRILYRIDKLDDDQRNGVMYLYLTEVRRNVAD